MACSANDIRMKTQSCRLTLSPVRRGKKANSLRNAGRIVYFMGAALFFIVTLVDSVLARGVPVSGATLRNLHGIYVAVWKGHRARVKIARDGTLRAVSDNRFDEGRWKVEGDVLCVSFKVWTKGRYKCGRVYRNGRWFEGLYRKDGTPRLRFRR